MLRRKFSSLLSSSPVFSSFTSTLSFFPLWSFLIRSFLSSIIHSLPAHSHPHTVDRSILSPFYHCKPPVISFSFSFLSTLYHTLLSSFFSFLSLSAAFTSLTHSLFFLDIPLGLTLLPTYQHKLHNTHTRTYFTRTAAHTPHHFVPQDRISHPSRLSTADR